MFYFQQLLNTALAGIDGTAIISTVTNIAFAIRSRAGWDSSNSSSQTILL